MSTHLNKEKHKPALHASIEPRPGEQGKPKLEACKGRARREEAGLPGAVTCKVSSVLITSGWHKTATPDNVNTTEFIAAHTHHYSS